MIKLKQHVIYTQMSWS